MTIKEFCQIADTFHDIKIKFNGHTENFNRNEDSLQFHTYGPYIIERVSIADKDTFLVEIKTIPART